MERRKGNYNEKNVQKCYQLQPAPSVGNLEGNVFREDFRERDVVRANTLLGYIFGGATDLYVSSERWFLQLNVCTNRLTYTGTFNDIIAFTLSITYTIFRSDPCTICRTHT